MHSASLDPASPRFRWQRRIALLLITLTSVFSIADRQVLSVVLEPIKAEFGLSDTELGLLSGLAFSAFYATFALPLARLADRTARRWIIAGSLAVFSAMTALCGAASSFVLLFCARIGVGIGEGGAGPAGLSVIADYYPPAQRTSAMSVLALGATIGVVAGLAIGGAVSGAYGWRAAFLAIGLPGLIFAIIVAAWLREAPRGFAEGRSASADAARLIDVVAFIWNNLAARHLIAATVLYNTVTFALMQWAPAYYMRVFDMPAGQAGPLLGAVVGLVGAGGIIVGGLLAQRLENIRPAYGVWMVAATTLAAVPLAVGSFLANSVAAAIALFCAPIFVGNFYIAPATSLIQGLAPLRMRATAAALVLFANAMIGGVAGPVLVGIISDALHPRFGEDSLRYGLIACLMFWVWAALHMVLCGRKLDAGLAAARDEAAATAPDS